MAKVFQILVPDNTLVSRIISCENQVTELFVIDRADKHFVSDYSSDLTKPALYILINRDAKKLYVGETDDSFKRLKNHEAKDFWSEAIVFHSTTDTLSTTEVKWLEAKTYEALSNLGYYDLSENKQKPQFPPLKRNQIYTLEPIFEEAKNYICAAGFDIFLKDKKEESSFVHDDSPTTEHEKEKTESSEYHIFKLNIKNTNAIVHFYPNERRYVILAGSQVRRESTDSFDNKASIEKRDEVFADKTWSVPDGDSMVLLKDVEFVLDTPNVPVQFCTARSTNATTALIDAEGRTYAEVFPKDRKTVVPPKETNVAPFSDSDFLGRCASKLMKAVGQPLVKKGRSVYVTTDGKTGYVIRTSKMYPQGNREKYWYAYRRNKEVMDCEQQFFVYGCRDENTIIVLPVSEIEHQLECLNNTKDANDNPLYWHIVFLKDNDGKITWLISKPKVHEMEITDRLLGK